MEIFSPKIDVVFCKLFGSENNKDILISFINSVVGPEIVVTEIRILNPYNLASYVGAKKSIVDVKAVDQKGNRYNIEMQIYGKAEYGKRAVYYASKLLTDSLDEGMPFSEINITIGIHLLDFNMFQDDRYVHHYSFMDMETNEYNKHLGYIHLYFVEMKKFGKQYNEIKEPLDRWIAFLNHAQEMQRDNLPEPLITEPAIIKAVKELEIMGLDPLERDIYEREVEAAMFDEANRQFYIEEGRTEGIAVGIEQGKVEGREEGIEIGLEKGMEKILSLQLERRFSTLPDSITSRLDKLTPNQMNELAVSIFDMSSLADLEKWLDAHK